MSIDLTSDDDAPVIVSLLDTDLYKFTMWQALLHAHPANQAEYVFTSRGAVDPPLGPLVDAVNHQLDLLCRLQFGEDELAGLAGLRYMRSDFIDFLRLFHFQRPFIRAEADGDTLAIVARGPQVHVMAFEVFVLAIVSELHYRRTDRERAWTVGRERLAAKIALVRDAAAGGALAGRHAFEFSDFGTRRRYSRAWHAEVVRTLQRELPGWFKGTSNVALAADHGVVPIGTMAHEYLQTFQATGVQLRRFQAAALEAWVQEYRGDLGIALTDVVGMDAFLRDFDLYFAKLFDGLRHDSGDPVEWGEKALAHYASLRIDARTKRLVFSDRLDLPKAIALYRHFADRTMVGFGIGTDLTNDVGVAPLGIVMKLERCNGQPVAKLSDTPAKTTSTDPTFLAYLRQVFEVTT